MKFLYKIILIKIIFNNNINKIMIKYNLNVFANLSKISSIMKGGAMTPVMESTLESGPIEEVIAFLETQDLNNPSNYPLLISIFSLIFKRSIDFQIKMLDYFYTKSIPIYFEYLNMKCNTYSITIKNFLSGDPNTDFDQKLLLLKRIIEVMSLSPDNTSNSFFFIENLFWSITYMKRLAPDRRMAFLEILTSYIDLSKICQAINHFSSRPIFFSNASIKNYIPLIFMFVYQTNKELDTQFYINFFSKNLFKGLNKVLDKDVSKKLITDCFSFILKQEDSPNKRAFFGINNKGQTVFQNLFSKLVLSTEDAISYYTPLLIELIINSPTQTLLEQGQAGQTILHNMIFNNYPLSLIARTFEKAPLLIEICDDKKRYPIFYVAEFKSSIELFKFIKQQTPSKYYKILSTQQKFILEFLFKNFSTISYEATDIADFIQDNNHLTLINSIESFSYIEARGLYDPDLKCTNKTLQQIIAYKLYKDTRDGASSISIEKKRALLTAIGGVPIPQNNNVREIRINKAGNIIEQYLAVLKTAPNNLNSNTTYFKILGEHAIDAGGPQRTVWGLLQKEFLGDKYCETLNGKIYFRAVNSEAAFIALGNMIGRAYIYGPQVQKQTNERDAWGDLIIKNIYSSLGMLSPEMSKIILVGLFNTIIPERLEELIAADCAPNEDSLNSWLFDNINSLIQFGGPDGIPLQIEDSIENILRNIEVFHDYTVMYESELNVLQFFHELIFIDSTKSKIDPNFIAWVNLYNTELKALEVKKKELQYQEENLTQQERMQIFFKTLQESGFLMKIDKMKDQAIGCITKSNELVIRPCIESFLRNKPNIIEGINQIIYGFFEIDIRRIMKKNVKEININIKTITSKVVFEMSHAHKIIMQKVVSKVLKLLDETGDLVKFVEYFSGIPLILSDSEIYTLKTWRGQNFSEHTCFYYVDIPEAFIRRDNIETLAVQFAAVIRAAETKFGMA